MSKRAVVLISGSGSNLQALIDAAAKADCAYEVAGVISNVEGVYGLERAQSAGIATTVVRHGDFESREAFDEELARAIDAYSPDFVILAGFMRILSDGFVAKYAGRMLNIHPSLLPKYRGLHTHRRAIEAGDKEHGASVHFVSAELDGGPVIVQATVPVEEGDDEKALAARVLIQEHRIYPLAAQWLASGRVALQDNRVVFADVALSQPVTIDGIPTP